MCIVHSAQVVASSVKLRAESNGSPELGNRLLNQEDALRGCAHGRKLLQDQAPIV